MSELTDEQAVAITTLQGMIKTLISLGLQPDVIQHYIDAIYTEGTPDILMQTTEIAPQPFDYEVHEISDYPKKNEPRESGTDETPADGQ